MAGLVLVLLLVLGVSTGCGEDCDDIYRGANCWPNKTGKKLKCCEGVCTAKNLRYGGTLVTLYTCQ